MHGTDQTSASTFLLYKQVLVAQHIHELLAVPFGGR